MQSKTKNKILITSGIGLTTSLLFLLYRYKLKNDKTIYRIKNIDNVKHLIPQTVELLESEWKNQNDRHPLYNKQESKEEKKEPIP